MEKDAPHHRGASHKGRPQHREIAPVKLLQQEQRLIWMNLAMFSAVFCCFVIRGLRASVLNVGDVLSPLPRSLSSYAPAVRLRRAAGACIKLEKPNGRVM